jgi:ATP-dependent helicase/nuclease subunit B
VYYNSAYHNTLEDSGLDQLIKRSETRPDSTDKAALPEREIRPAPSLPAGIQVKNWSVHTHQRLIDCPYRFFSADALGLKPQDEIRQALSKGDYGSLVHRIVQAFHCKLPGLPGPWRGQLNDSRRDQAVRLLGDISQAVFAEAIEDNFQARGWLKRWLAVLPGYLDWEIERQADWQLRDVEVKAEKAFSEHLHMNGRIDRVDQRSGASALVDYKTGRAPKSEQVTSGEAVQLPSYALLIDQPVCQLDYLEFGKDEVQPQTCADGEQLRQLMGEVGQRLVQLDQALQQQAPLPAWGDPGTCRYCEFDALCRREMWLHGDGSDD